jgi:hypothetical protein
MSVSTRSTARSRTAAAGSIRSTLPRATVLHTNAAYNRSLAGLSAAYSALPVTFSRPSTRVTG